MASVALRRSQNVPGGMFVDETCIDCGTCMWMAPDVFEERGGKSAVHAQPTPELRHRAHQALVACPTASIGSDEPAAVREAAASFPVAWTQDVWHCGYHAEGSFGATSWLVRTQAGNVLIDSPRFAGPLVQRLEEMGGVDWMLFTHRDDVADHARYHDHFGCPRVVHAGDAGAVDAEVVLEGDEGEVAGLRWMHVPGHTRGHAVFLHHDALFTGDHLAWSQERKRLVAFRRACWYDWGKQTRSMERLAAWRFRHVLPGHGAPVTLPEGQAPAEMARLLEWMRRA